MSQSGPEESPSMAVMIRCLAYMALAIFAIGATFATSGFRVGFGLLGLWLLGITTGRLLGREHP